MRATKRIGVFGGAFDPPHRAHHAVAQAALEQLQLDRLHIIPTGLAWHKTRVLSAAEHRAAMCRLAFADLAGAVIDMREVKRHAPSYTVDTLTELRAEYPDAQWVLVLGADQLLAFHSWLRYSEILDLVQLAVAPRGLGHGEGAMDVGVVDIPHTRLKLPVDAISATKIRQQNTTLTTATALDSVHPEVARYIAQHHLYSKSPT